MRICSPLRLLTQCCGGQRGKGISMASFLEIDAVIDPLETRGWLMRGLHSAPDEALLKGTRPFVDTW